MKCGQSYDSGRDVCKMCHMYNICDIELCKTMLLKSKSDKEIDYWNSRIAENIGG